MPSTRRQSSSESCCCICGITDSTKAVVKSDKISKRVFLECFKLRRERNGDLCIDCNAIARRWTRMSTSARNKADFSEVVDSKRKAVPRRTKRSSRSSESMSSTEVENNNEKKIAQEHIDNNQNDDTLKNNEKESVVPIIEDALSEDDNDDNDDESDNDMEIADDPPLAFDTPCFSPAKPEDGIEDTHIKETATIATQTAFLFPALTSPQANANKLPFIDLSKWRQEEICCGTIFRGPNGEVLVDPKWLRPSCQMCNRSTQPPTPIEKGSSESISVFDEKLASLCS